jgi:hypothetical protein
VSERMPAWFEINALFVSLAFWLRRCRPSNGIVSFAPGVGHDTHLRRAVLAGMVDRVLMHGSLYDLLSHVTFKWAL